jgi:hypothetical protein
MKRGGMTKEEHDLLFEARRIRIARMWQTMSAREIGIELDMGASSVIREATNMGLKSRKISARP